MLSDEDGATAIEYAMIAGLISIVILTVMSQIGQTVLSFFQDMIVPFI